MKVLVVTDVLWRDDNGVGNSYSNIFNGIKDLTVANICCKRGTSNNSISSKCFQISEAGILRNIKNKNYPSGIVEEKKQDTSTPQRDSKLVRIIKRSRLQIFFWMVNLIWKTGRWKSKELDAFIDEFNPDVIFAQLQDKPYLNDVVRYVKKRADKPLCLYAWDDVYSLKQFSLSPLFWIDRFMQRRSIRKVVKQCNVLYTICAEQQEEYKRTLKANTKLLYKGYDFVNKEYEKTDIKKPLEILYTGNLYSGRYKTLKKFCKLLAKINKDQVKAKLSIYSATPLTKKEIKKINIPNVSEFFGQVKSREVQFLQEKADVLLHLEPFTLKGSLLCRLSFSTKLVDYFYNGKCVFAVGSKRCSSMKYLERNDSAITVTNLKELYSAMEQTFSSTEKVTEYSVKAFETGKKNHQITQIQGALINDFTELINSK